MAIYLARAGARVTLVERRPDPRRAGAAAGRSINLAISTRGLHALAGVGLEKPVLDMSVSMRGRMIHSSSGSTVFQPYGTEAHQAIRSVSRGGLNQLLLEAAEKEAEGSVLFDSPCRDVDLERGSVIVEQSGERKEIAGDWVLGADGAFSAIRARMQRTDRFNYQQFYLDHGYKELTIPAAAGGGFAMEPEALHIWPRGGYMMIALPNQDGSFTCTLFWPFSGANSFENLQSESQVDEFFSRNFPDARPLMPDLGAEYFENPTSSLVTVRCAPWSHADRVVMLGDACHAVVPFYGQGANASFEDCVILDECLSRHPADLGKAFREYETVRKEHVDVLSDLALENFIEMRDHTASALFRGKKRLERVLHRLFPRRFVPLYTMVTFSRLLYGDAVERARRQWRAVLLAALISGFAGTAVLLWFLSRLL